MEKKYRRTPDIYTFILIVGLIVVIDSFRIQNFVWLYDGIKFLVALIVALYGLWGLITPIATLAGQHLRVNATVFKTKDFDLNAASADFDERQDIIEVKDQKKSHSIKTRNIRSRDRTQFKSDLKAAREGKTEEGKSGQKESKEGNSGQEKSGEKEQSQ